MNTNLAYSEEQIISNNTQIQSQEDHNLNSFGYYKLLSFQLQNQSQICACLYVNEQHSTIPYILQLTIPSIFNFSNQLIPFNEYFAIEVNGMNEVTKVNRLYVDCNETICNLEIGEELIFSSLVGEQIPVIL